ncbi:MAG TPA: cysteine hydrolase, partial [Dongiaceae bacterium]
MISAADIQGLRFGAIGGRAVHVAVDMQVVFAEDPDWGAASTAEIAPRVARIAARWPERTIFTRFLPPPSLAAAPGQW